MSYRTNQGSDVFRYPMTLILTIVVTAGTLILTYCAGTMSGLALDRPELESTSTMVAALALIMVSVGPLMTLGFYRLERGKPTKTIAAPVGDIQS